MLKGIPDTQDLSRLYFELSKKGAPLVGKKETWAYTISSEEELLVLSLEMSRYDPRLFGILVGWITQGWKKFNPLRIRELMRDMQTPQILGVVKNLAKHVSKDPELSYFLDYLTRGLQPVSEQLFFKGMYPLGGILMEKAATQSLKEFHEWGFLCSDRPMVDPFKKLTVGKLDKKTRLHILEQLCKRQRKIKLSDYLRAIDRSVSRQQALSDLKSLKTIRCRGYGREAHWIWRD